ncbi:hypothetical protein GINT2_000908 [Glugoides intestinalis]
MEIVKSEVIWNNLELKTSEGKRVISSISGSARAGKITAIMGPSGAGKTSFLNCLAGRFPLEMSLNGEIKINGADRNPKTWPHLVSYVCQQFHCYTWQTVRETLEFVASIKCRKSENAENRVEELLNILGLSGVQETLVGKLSGGERVRVSIGIELLGDPAILILDEPLSGLDSFNALGILALLRSIGKTTLLSVHQPSYKMLEHVDRIMLVCQGFSIVEGTLNECIEFFSSCGFEVPLNTTPTEFFLDILALDTSSKKMREESINRINMVKKEACLINQPFESTVFTRLSNYQVFQKQTGIKALLARLLISHSRDVKTLSIRAFQKFFVAIVFGSTFYSTGVIGASVFSFRGILTFLFQSEFFSVSSLVMSVFIEEKKIISRERMAGLYSGYKAYFSKFLGDFLITAFFSIPCNIFIYLMIGFSRDLKTLFEFLLIILAVIAYAISFGLTISTVTPTIQAAQALGVTFNVTSFLYSGAVSDLKSKSGIFHIACWLSPMHYAFRALAHNQLSRLENVTSSLPLKVSGKSTLDSFGMTGFGVYPCLFVLFLFSACVQFIGATLLHYKTSNNLKLLSTPKQQV